MKWSNLQNGDCPKCGAQLKQDVEYDRLICDCSFKISNAKFKTITSNQAEGRVRVFHKPTPEEDRLSELNNLEV